MILSFGDRATEDLYNGKHTARSRRFPREVIRTARRKMDMLQAASELVDLKAPPGNRLESLRGTWKGFYSIRVSDQWRIVFRWIEGNAADVSMSDHYR